MTIQFNNSSNSLQGFQPNGVNTLSLYNAYIYNPTLIDSVSVKSTTNSLALNLGKYTAYSNFLYKKLSGTSSTISPTLYLNGTDAIVISESTINKSTDSGKNWTQSTFVPGVFYSYGGISKTTLGYVTNSTDGSVFAFGGTDGITWTIPNVFPVIPTSSYLNYANGKIFLTSGGWGSASSIYYLSNDLGVTLTQYAAPASGSFGPVLYINGNYILAQGLNGSNGPGDKVWTSTDGLTWTSRTMPANGYGFNFVTNGTTVVGTTQSNGSNTVHNIVFYSADNGITWSLKAFATSTTGWAPLAYGNGRYVALPAGTGTGSVASNVTSYSTDGGLTWTGATTSATINWNFLVYGNKFVGLANNNATSTTSTDGITWASVTMPSASAWSSLIWTGTMYIVNIANSATYYTSTDAVTWTTRTLPSASNWAGMVWTGTQVILTILNSKSFYTSTDGINWNSNGITTGNYAPIVAFNNYHLMLSKASAASILYSTTATNWTSATLPSTATWSQVTPVNSLVFVTNILSAQTTIAKSSNATTWTASTMPSSAIWGDPAYGNSIHIMMTKTVSPTTAVSAYASSPDGTTWTARTLPSSNIWINPVYNGQNFVLISTDGNTILVSADGINWTTSALQINEPVYSAVSSTNSTLVSLGDNKVAILLHADVAGSIALKTDTVLLGNYATADTISKLIYSPTIFATSGDAQKSTLVLVKSTANNTPILITTNGAAATALNQYIVKNNSVNYVKGSIASRSSTGDVKTWTIEGTIKRGAAAVNTAIVGSFTVTAISADTGAAAWTLAATADTTNGALAITVTGDATNAVRWICILETTEGTF